MQSKTILLCLAIFVAAIATVNSENAFYIPRSFYTIDAGGHQSQLSVIGARHQNAILHRLKRSAAGSDYSPKSSRSLLVSRINRA